ncbi:MAG: ABC transporter permease [Acidobacteriota bacterium]
MIRHLLRIVWNRKRANVLVAFEILLSFLVLCAVATMVVYYVDNYRQPLGYVWQDTWVVSMDANVQDTPGSDAKTGAPGTGPRARQRAQVARFLGIVRDLPEVASVSAAFLGPYDNSTWRSSVKVGGKEYRYFYNEATDDFADTLRMNVLQGRWFNASDDGSDWQAAVINRRLAREMFGDEDPIGKLVEDETERDPKSPTQGDKTRLRIVGVIDDFRKDGEYSPPDNFLIARNRLDDPSETVFPPGRLLVRVRPGTTAAFEEKLIGRLRAAAPDWTFQSEPLEAKRAEARLAYVGPLAAYGVVAIFLLIMVALGLTGVLWLNVTQRTREIGLRRAKGATILNVQQQLVGEVAVLTSLAVLVGIVLVVQFPLLDLYGDIPATVYMAGLGLALVGIYGLTLACAYVPSRLAGKVQPAEALRYE